jgi:hypothetical protein
MTAECFPIPAGSRAVADWRVILSDHRRFATREGVIQRFTCPVSHRAESLGTTAVLAGPQPV